MVSDEEIAMTKVLYACCFRKRVLCTMLIVSVSVNWNSFICGATAISSNHTKVYFNNYPSSLINSKDYCKLILKTIDL